MTRLTPGDLRHIRERGGHDVDRLLAEIDALRAEIATMADDRDGESNARDLAELLVKGYREQIATFRNASQSLCNCSQCLDIREEFAE